MLKFSRLAKKYGIIGVTIDNDEDKTPDSIKDGEIYNSKGKKISITYNIRLIVGYESVNDVARFNEYLVGKNLKMAWRPYNRSTPEDVALTKAIKENVIKHHSLHDIVLSLFA